MTIKRAKSTKKIVYRNGQIKRNTDCKCCDDGGDPPVPTPCEPCQFYLSITAVAQSNPPFNLGTATATATGYETASSQDVITLGDVAEGDLMRVLYRGVFDQGVSGPTEIWWIDFYTGFLSTSSQSVAITGCETQENLSISDPAAPYEFVNCGHPEADEETCAVSGTGIIYEIDVIEASQFTCCPLDGPVGGATVGYGNLLSSDGNDSLETFNQNNYATPIRLNWAVYDGTMTYGAGVLEVDDTTNNKWEGEDLGISLQIGGDGLGDVWKDGSFDWEAFSIYYSDGVNFVEADGPAANTTWDTGATESITFTLEDPYGFGEVYSIDLSIC